MTLQQIQDKLVIIGKKIRSQRDRIDEISEDITHNLAGEGAVGMGYVSLSQTEEKADDQTLQITRLYDLIEQCEKRYNTVNEQINKHGLPKDSEDQYKQIDCEIWYIEIDLENIGDM